LSSHDSDSNSDWHDVLWLKVHQEKAKAGGYSGCSRTNAWKYSWVTLLSSSNGKYDSLLASKPNKNTPLTGLENLIRKQVHEFPLASPKIQRIPKPRNLITLEIEVTQGATAVDVFDHETTSSCSSASGLCQGASSFSQVGLD